MSCLFTAIFATASAKKKRKRKEKVKRKGKKEIREDRTVIVVQRRDASRIAFERALDKECLQEPADAKQFVNSAFTCPLLQSQMYMNFAVASVHTEPVTGSNELCFLKVSPNVCCFPLGACGLVRAQRHRVRQHLFSARNAKNTTHSFCTKSVCRWLLTAYDIFGNNPCLWLCMSVISSTGS